MMTAFRPQYTLGAACALCLTLAASMASAQETRLYDMPSPDTPIMVAGPKGIIFLHKDGKPFRAYKVKKSTKLHVTELDQDGNPDIIGLGKPMFVIGGDAAPMWVDKKGCKASALADIVADDKLDIACTNGKEMKVLTYDNQFVWSMSIGRPLKSCNAGDTNGDLKAEIECSVGGKKYARFDSTGKLIDDAITEPMLDSDKLPFEPTEHAGDKVVADMTLFDFDKNGTAEEFLVMEDNLLVVKSKALDKPLAMTELKGGLKAALVKDIDGDGVQEVIAISSKSLHVLSVDGKKNESYSLKASSYKRKPLADLQSVYANGFADNEAAKKGVTDIQDKLSSCYASQLKKTQFAGSGQMLLQVKVDGEGKIQGIDTTHSDVADKKVAKCAKKHLKKASFPKASGDSASVNITILYTFRDQ